MSTAHPNVWSSWLKTTATTEPSFPLAPSSSPLAFMVSDSGNRSTELITFHWRKQPNDKQHGPEFRYLVTNEQNETEVSVPYWDQEVPRSKKLTLEVAGLNSIGKSHEVLRMSSLNKGGGDSGVGPSVVVTRENGDTVVLWGEPGKDVVERQVIWGAGSTHLLEEGIDWADVGNTAGNLTLHTTNPPPQHVFLAARNADGSSRGMEKVGCRLTSRHAPNISLVLSNASSNSVELKIGLGLKDCRGEEDEKLLFQKATLNICTSKDNCRSKDSCKPPSHHNSTYVTVPDLQTSTCFCVDLEVETVLGNASLVSSPSPSCSFHTGFIITFYILLLENISNRRFHSSCELTKNPGSSPGRGQCGG